MLTCPVLGFSKQAFYKWQANPITDREWSDAHLINTALDIHHGDPAFGYRFIADQLAKHGITRRRTGCSGCVSRNGSGRCSRRRQGSHDALGHRCTTTSSLSKTRSTADPEKSSAGRPRPKPSTSSYGPSNTQVLQRLLEPGQFRSTAFVTALKSHRLVGSMGRVGACGDNAAMESFFSLLQKNVLDQQRWTSREELRVAIVIWIERTYHRRRRQRGLGRLTPIEYETINKAAHVA